MKIIFVRHGETNIKTGKLTRKGVSQIKDAAKYLKTEKIDMIYCSPKTRAIQSANILKEKLGIADIKIEKNLTERQLLSEEQAILYKDFYDKNYLNYDFDTDKFDTCKDFIDRNFKAFKKIVSANKKGATILVVAHSSTLYAINAYINGIPKDNQIIWLQCSNGAVVKFHI